MKNMTLKTEKSRRLPITLTIRDDVKKKFKKWSKRHGTTPSRNVENYMIKAMKKDG